ncbi:MAG: T9SS type A sorting domain-containing protein [Bacteroidetes bacterium]|nr:T9SS type A sorting domain-containing protein [Bacteroidota bacterium]
MKNIKDYIKLMLLTLALTGMNTIYSQCSYTAGVGCTSSVTSPLTISGTTSWTGTVCVGYDVTIASGGTLTISSGTNVSFDDDVSIIVEDGGTLEIFNSELYAQGASGMWQGIIGEAGSYITVDESKILHAYIGVDVEGSSTGSTYFYSVNGSCFVNNEIGIYMHDNPDGLVHLIEDTEFSASALVSPKNGEVGDYGILVEGSATAGVDFFQVGNTANYSSSTTYNYFHDIAIGIRAYEANLKVQNCLIGNMLTSDDLPTGTPLDEDSDYDGTGGGNVGILSTSNPSSPNFERDLIVGLTLLSGGLLNNEIYTDATNGFIGIAAKTKVSTQIYSNRISGDDISGDFILEEGIRVHEDHSDHDMQRNVISNFETHGIRSVNITGRNTLIQDNTITRTYDPSSSEFPYGILVNASSTNQDLDILDNTIDHVETGIYVKNHDEAVVSGNVIEVDRGASSAIGIDITSCEDILIAENSVVGNCNNATCSGSSNNNIGIWVTTSDGMFITKNYVENLTTGILVEGTNETGNMTCNELHDCLTGFGMLDVVVDPFSDDIGPIERTGIGPSDNSWYSASVTNRERHLGSVTDLRDLTWKYRNLDLDGITSLPAFDMPNSLISPSVPIPEALEPTLVFADENATCSSPYRMSGDDAELALFDIQNNFVHWLNRETPLNDASEYVYRSYYYQSVTKTAGLAELLEDEYAAMYTSIAESNIPAYYEIKAALDNYALDSVIEMLGDITPANDMETALSTMLNYINSYRNNGLSPVLEGEEFDEINALAHADAKVYGDAVFMAQGLLNVVIHPELDMEETERLGDFTEQASYTLSPNPGSKYILITSSIDDENFYLITITDIIGKKLLQKDGYQFGNNLDIGELAEGMYIVTVSKNNELIFSQKLIKTNEK